MDWKTAQKHILMMVEHLTQFTDNKEFEINLPNRKEFLEDNKKINLIK